MDTRILFGYHCRIYLRIRILREVLYADTDTLNCWYPSFRIRLRIQAPFAYCIHGYGYHSVCGCMHTDTSMMAPSDTVPPNTGWSEARAAHNCESSDSDDYSDVGSCMGSPHKHAHNLTAHSTERPSIDPSSSESTRDITSGSRRRLCWCPLDSGFTSSVLRVNGKKGSTSHQ